MSSFGVNVRRGIGRLLLPDRVVLAVFVISFGILLLRLLLLFPPFLGDPMPLYELLLVPFHVAIEFGTGLVGLPSRIGDGPALVLLAAYFYVLSVLVVRGIDFTLERLQDAG